MGAYQTGDQNLVKKINKSIVLSAIQHHSPISRAQIAKDTKLNKATVSTMVTELIEESFVYEIGQGQSSGGRKPVMLYFNNNAGYAIGIDLGVNYLLAVLTDLNGEIIQEMQIPLLNTEVTYITETLLSVIETLKNNAPKSHYGIVGIGLGIPGFVDKDGIVLQASGLKWKNVNLRKPIEEAFHVPVIIENEANAGTIGEQVFGAAKHIANLVYVGVGMGIGTGIIIDDQLFKGSTGIAAEMGHMTIEPKGKKCFCGNRGCWELYASEKALLEEGQNLTVFKNGTPPDLESILNEVRKGNGEAIHLLNYISEYLSIGLVNIINTFNPEVIIIGSRYSYFEKWMLNSIERILDERLSPYHRKSTKIMFSTLGNHSTCLGSTFLAVSQFLSPHKVSVQ